MTCLLTRLLKSPPYFSDYFHLFYSTVYPNSCKKDHFLPYYSFPYLSNVLQNKIYTYFLAHKVLYQLFPFCRMMLLIPFVPGSPFHFLHSQVIIVILPFTWKCPLRLNTTQWLHLKVPLLLSSIIPYRLACWPFTFSNTHFLHLGDKQTCSSLCNWPPLTRGSFSFRLQPNNFTIFSKSLTSPCLSNSPPLQ